MDIFEIETYEDIDETYNNSPFIVERAKAFTADFRKAIKGKTSAMVHADVATTLLLGEAFELVMTGEGPQTFLGTLDGTAIFLSEGDAIGTTVIP